MRLSQVNYRQHLGFMFKKHWRIQGQRVPYETGAEAELKNRGITVIESSDVLKEKRERFDIQVLGYLPKPIELNSSHPHWHDKVCYILGDNNVLLEGVDQAKVLLKTVEVQSGLPSSLQDAVANLEIPPEVDNLVQRSVLSSNVFDTEQLKLAKIKDPNRPAYNFPRVLGITEARKYKLIVSKLMQICEKFAGPEITTNRSVLCNNYFSVPIEKDGDTIQFQLTAETLVCSRQGLKPILDQVQETENIELPDLFPIKHTITIPKENIYQLKNCYPLRTSTKSSSHTVITQYNPVEVGNLYEKQVTENQIIGRSLTKAFAVAAANARQIYGESVNKLPEPVTVQCIHTDGHMFHFSVLQLNTLSLNGKEGTKNVWYQAPRLPLFSQCNYMDGRPVLVGYNKQVFRHIVAFYMNN